MEQKKVLITGGTGGIGSACVDGFLSKGFEVYTTSSSQNKLDNLLNSFANYENYLNGCVSNLEEKQEVNNVVKNALDKMSQIDILICNAGITIDKLAIRTDISEWLRVLQVNLHANFKLATDALKHMMKRKKGRIIFISSVVASTGNIGQCSYTSSKAALEGMMRTLALEAALITAAKNNNEENNTEDTETITVNAIAPGFIDTQMTSKLPEPVQKKILEKIPFGFQGSAKDIFAAVEFLASDGARYITGHTMHVNGGMYCN